MDNSQRLAEIRAELAKRNPRLLEIQDELQKRNPGFLKSVGQGFVASGQEMVKNLSNAIPKTGTALDNFTSPFDQSKQADAALRQYKENAPTEFSSKAGRMIGGALPGVAMAMLPGGAISKAAPFAVKAAGLASEAVANAAGAMVDPNVENKNLGAGIAAGSGVLGRSLVPMYHGIKAVGNAVARLVGNKEKIIQSMLDDLTPGSLQEAESLVNASKKAGIDLRPDQAIKNPKLTAATQEAGAGSEGANILMTHAAKQDKQAKEAANNILNTAYNNSSNDGVLQSFNSFAEKKIAGMKSDLAAKAEPFYQKAYKTTVKPEIEQKLLQNDVISSVAQNVDKNPAISESLKSFPPKSVGYWDNVKKVLDGQLRSYKQGTVEYNQTKNAINQIRNEMDKISPAYAKARSIYVEGSDDVNSLISSKLGLAADASEQQLDGLLKKVFNPKQDMTGFKKLHKAVTESNPILWNQLLKRHLTSVIDSINTIGRQTGDEAFALGKALFKDNANRKLLLEATKHDPALFNRVNSTQKALQNISKLPKPGNLEIHFDATNSTRPIAQAWHAVKGKIFTNYQKALAEIMTDPNWHSEFMKIANKKASDKVSQLYNFISNLNAQLTANVADQHQSPQE